jgi:hypothetical protein
MSKPILKNELAQTVAQHNTLVNARFHMEEIETKLFISGLGRIKRTDKEFSVCEIHKSEILPDVSGGRSYELIKDAVFRLADRIIKIENTEEKKKRKFIAIPLIALCEYEEGTGFIKLLFNNSVMPYLLNLQGNFTVSQIKYLFRLKKYSSHRLYWLLKSNFYGSTVEFEKDVDEIKEMLGIEGKYPNYFDFDKRILKPAWEEIQNTDMKYDYTPVKIGKGIKKIIFIKKEAFLPEENPGPVLPGIILSPALEKQLLDAGIASIDVIARMVYENKIDEGYVRFCLAYKRTKTENLSGAIFTDIVHLYKMAAYKKTLKSKKEAQVRSAGPQSSTQEKTIIKYELSGCREAYETTRSKGLAKYSTWEETFQKAYLEEGFKLVKEAGKEYLVKE